MPCEGRLGCAGDRIPQPNRVVITPTGKRTPIGTERHGPDRRPMPSEGRLVCAGDRIPQPNRVVITPTGKRTPIGGEHDAPDPIPMPFEGGVRNILSKGVR